MKIKDMKEKDNRTYWGFHVGLEGKEENWESFIGLCLEQLTGYTVVLFNEMEKTKGEAGFRRKTEVLIVCVKEMSNTQ